MKRILFEKLNTEAMKQAGIGGANAMDKPTTGSCTKSSANSGGCAPLPSPNCDNPSPLECEGNPDNICI